MSYTYTITDTCNNGIVLTNNQSILITSSGTINNFNFGNKIGITVIGNNNSIVNNGQVMGQNGGVINVGTITNLYNSQNNLIYWDGGNFSGIFPQNYYITIQSGSTYGSLSASGVQGSMTFNIDPSSIIDLNQLTYNQLTYSNVLTVIANDHLIGATGTNPNYTVTGVFNNYDWTLSTSNNSNWNLTFSSIFSSIYNDNIYILTNPNQLLESNLSISNKQNIIIPKDYTLTISPNIVIDNSGALINYGTIIIQSGAAITNTSSGIILNEFSGTIINDSSNNSNTNSGKIINRGLYENELSISSFTNGLGGIFLNKNGGIFDNSGTVINSPSGLFTNYYNYLRVNIGGKVINYGQYINDIIYASGATIIPPFNLIAAGTNHSLGLRYNVNGDLYAWGNNTSGQLGNNINFTNSLTPAAVYSTGLNGTKWINVASGGNTSFGLRYGGYLYAWGDNTSGHLGIGSSDTSRNYPSQVSLSNCIAVSSGLNHALALDNSNNAWTWGDNTYGQLGNRTNTSSNVPNEVLIQTFYPSTSPQPYTITNPNTKFITIGIAGGYGGRGNSIGGYGAFVTVPNIPVSLGQTIYFDIGGNGGNVSTGSAGSGIIDPKWSTTAILSGGPGAGSGNGGGGGGGSLVYIDNSTNLIAVAGGGGGSYVTDPALILNGGNAGNGTLGNGTGVGGVNDIGNGSGTNFTVGGIGGNGNNGQIYSTGGGGGGGYGGGGSGGSQFFTIYTFGYGGGGNGGNGDGYNHTYAGGAGGSYINPIYNTNYSANIVLNNPPTNPRVSYIEEYSSINTVSSTTVKIISVNTGDNHSLAISQSGNLSTWGNNSSGQLGLGVTPDTSRNYPSLVQNPNPSYANWLKAVGGTNHSLGLQSDGSLWAWGDNTYGQLGNGIIGTSYITLNISNFSLNTSFSSNDGAYGYYGDSFGNIYKVDLSNNMSIVSTISNQTAYALTTSFSSIDGAYGYFGDSAGTGYPARIYRVNLSNNMSIDLSLNLPNNNSLLKTSFTSPDGTYGYFGDNNGSIYKVDLPNMANTPIIFTFGVLAPINSSFISPTDNSTGYFMLGTSIYKATISGSSSGIPPYTSLNIGQAIFTSFCSNDGAYGYLGGNQGNIYKVQLSTLTLINTYNTGTNIQLNTSFTPDGGITGFFTNNSGRVYKLNLSTMTLISEYNISPTNTVSFKTSFSLNNGINNFFGDGNGNIYKINLSPIPSPRQVLLPSSSNNNNWVDIAAGANVSMAITNTNQLYAWGEGDMGQIGLSNPNNYYATPTLIPSPSNFIKCAIGGSHSLGISLNDNNLYAWGTNTSGQLGIGNTSTQNTPQEVDSPLNPILNTF